MKNTWYRERNKKVCWRFLFLMGLFVVSRIVMGNVNRFVFDHELYENVWYNALDTVIICGAVACASYAFATLNADSYELKQNAKKDETIK